MPSVLILCAHRRGRSPSQRYRFEQYLPLLEQQGFRFTYSFLLSKKDDVVFYSEGAFLPKVFILFKSAFIRLGDCLRFKNYDIVFVQREASFFGTAFFEKRARRSGAYLIFDFDDSIWLADTSPGNKKWEFVKKPEKFFKAVMYADLVIAGNKYLADKALTINKNTHIIPTTIDISIHIPKPELRNKEQLTIGWSGSISTVKHFETLAPVLQKLKERYKDKIKFKLLGHPNFSTVVPDIESVVWTADTEVDELNSFDIGVMPLPDDAWAQGKCGLKGLSYMACEVPTVMSDVGVNKEIIVTGKNGFLANNAQDWFNTLCKLIDNSALREEIGKAGRKTVIEKYSVEANKDLYVDIFSRALK